LGPGPGHSTGPSFPSAGSQVGIQVPDKLTPVDTGQLTLPNSGAVLSAGTVPAVTLPLAPQAIAANRDVGRLFPLITPSPVATPPAAAALSPAGAQPGQVSQVRRQLPARDQELALVGSLTGTRQAAGWILLMAVAAGAIAGLVLAKVRKRRVP
jgi:hypothetical protein